MFGHAVYFNFMLPEMVFFNDCVGHFRHYLSSDHCQL